MFVYLAFAPVSIKKLTLLGWKFLLKFNLSIRCGYLRPNDIRPKDIKPRDIRPKIYDLIYIRPTMQCNGQTPAVW